jgi:hypothetical protein
MRTWQLAMSTYHVCARLPGLSWPTHSSYQSVIQERTTIIRIRPVTLSSAFVPSRVPPPHFFASSWKISEVPARTLLRPACPLASTLAGPQTSATALIDISTCECECECDPITRLPGCCGHVQVPGAPPPPPCRRRIQGMISCLSKLAKGCQAKIFTTLTKTGLHLVGC